MTISENNLLRTIQRCGPSEVQRSEAPDLEHSPRREVGTRKLLRYSSRVLSLLTWHHRVALAFAAPNSGYWGLILTPGTPHRIHQASVRREPPKTKAELRQMLADAVRNTQPSAVGARSRRPTKISP